MALAETAKLVASLELQDKFSKQAGAAEGALGRLTKKTSTLSAVGGEASRGIGNAITNIKRLAVVGIGLVAANVVAGIQSIASIEKVQAQTTAVLKSTANAAGQSIDQITARSQKWSLAIGRNEEDVQDLQNLLLTFTNIGDKVFDDATTAALDMSQALGQDLKSSAIQLGKALNDPVKGITALSRVGVSFTEEQKDQVKAMVEANDTLGAQRLILAELNREFAGSAEAFGQTTAGRLERFKQAVQAGQRALAQGFLPILDKVVAKATELLNDPATISRIEGFGNTLAGALEEVLKIGGSLPWDSIGSAAKLLGQGSKALLDVFTGMPPWVQTAVLTGWGLNKLTGGALGNIAGILTKSAFGALRGATPANPVFVADVAGGAGAGGAAAGAGRSLLGTVGKFVLGPAAAVIVGSEIAAAINEPNIAVGRNFANEQIQARIDTGQAADIIAALHAVEDQQNTDDLLAQTSLIASNIPFIGDALGHVGPELEAQRQTLLDQLAEMGLTREEAEAIAARADRNHVEALAAQNTTINEFRTGRAEAAASAATIAGKADAQRAAIGRGFAESDDVAKTAAARVADRVQQARDAIGTGNAIARGVHGAVESSINEFRQGRTEIAAKTAAVAERVAAARDATRTGFQASNEKLDTISRKDFSPTVNVNTTIQSQVSIDAVNRAIVRSESRTTVGGGFLERAD